jgi:hypothetical protein
VNIIERWLADAIAACLESFGVVSNSLYTQLRLIIWQHKDGYMRHTFSDIKGVLTSVRKLRNAVRDDHFCHGCSVKNRSLAAMVIKSDLVDNQTLAGVKSNSKLPVHPANLVAVKLETDSIRLNDLQFLKSFLGGIG